MKSKIWKCQKKSLWSLKSFESDVLCSACVGSSVAGPSEKPRQAYTSFTFCTMSGLHTQCILYLHKAPSRNSSTECKQAASSAVYEQSPPPLRPSVPFPSHTQPCLACGARVSSLSCTWFLFGCQHSERLLAAIALGLHTSKWVLMSAQCKHKYIRKRCMGVKHRMPPLQSPEELASSSILR